MYCILPSFRCSCGSGIRWLRSSEICSGGTTEEVAVPELILRKRSCPAAAAAGSSSADGWTSTCRGWQCWSRCHGAWRIRWSQPEKPVSPATDLPDSESGSCSDVRRSTPSRWPMIGVAASPVSRPWFKRVRRHESLKVKKQRHNFRHRVTKKKHSRQLNRGARIINYRRS